jgi:DNA repair protein RecN (Recombination protein N)
MDESFSETAQKMQDIYYQLEEIAFQTRDYFDSVEFSSARLEQLEERLAEIDKAKRKYGRTIEEILSYAEKIRSEADALENQEAELGDLLSELRVLEETYETVARELSEKRRADGVKLSRSIERELADLGMQDTEIEIRLARSEEMFGEKGIDTVEFLISPNPGEPTRPLAKIASGGELSRVMLALKSVLKTDEFSKTLVFDEIDAGIGGRVANSLGAKLHKLSGRHQVFCVTHLPQIAALASQHFHVGKHAKGERTIVELACLDQHGRIEELARMLAGEAVTNTTLRQAEEMIKFP